MTSALNRVPKLGRTAPIMGVLLALAGCAVGPDFKSPAAPKDADYAPTPLPTTTVSAPVLGGAAQSLIACKDITADWWKVFQSPALDDLVALAIKNNPTIEAAQASLKQAQENVKAQRGQYFPQLTAGFNASRNFASTATNTISTPTNNNNQYYTLLTPQLALSFVPDVFGANSRSVESLEAQAETQKFALEATYITLASNVVTAALQEASLRAQIKATQDIIAFDTEAVRILGDQFRLGYAMRIDLAAQEAALAQAEALLPPLQKQFEINRDMIRALVGNLPNQDVMATFELASLQLPTDLPVSLPSEIIKQRPDVRAAEAQAHAASAQVGVAIAARLPQFTITGAAGGSSPYIENVFASGGPFWMIAAGVTAPLFDGFTLLHRERAADQALIAANATYRSTVLTAYQNVADTLHAIVTDAAGLKAAAEAAEAAKVTLDLTRQQNKIGYVDTLTLLVAETAYQTASVNLIQAQATRLGDTAALYQALGGGWWNRVGATQTAEK